MLSESINIVLIIILSAIQSIVGVGVLVIGTPTLLLFDLSIIEIINFLLPISIITSLLNIIIMKIKKTFYYDFNRLKSFFIFCIPSVFLGLVILKNFNQYINFDYIVSFIIIITLFLRKHISQFLIKISTNINKIILILIGIIHGLTNSGGSLLSIMMMNLNNSKKESRSEITLFYLILALIQFFLFYMIFDVEKNIHHYYFIGIYVIIGVVAGNVLLKFTKEILYRQLIYILALISSFFLIIKNFI